MEMEVHSYGVSQLLNSLPESFYPSPIGAKTPQMGVESSLIKPIVRDDRAELVEQAENLMKSSEPLDRSVISRLLHLCCEFDSADSAAALINGEVGGTLPVINEIDGSTGMTPLHTAAVNHAHRCIELLLRKRARTDLKTKAEAKAKAKATGGGSGSGSGSGAGAYCCLHSQKQQMLALELALRCSRMEVDWGPDEPLDDLLLLLSEKDLSVIRLLAEKTREVGEVAYSLAMEGQVDRLAALLMVAGERVNGTILELRTKDVLAAEKTTVYSCVIREAISVFSRVKQPSSKLSESKNDSHGGEHQRRKLLLREMELLHFFGASTNSGCGDKKAASLMILASQAGDEAVIKLLLRTDIDVNETDAEGNSALHWSLKVWKASSPEQRRILWLLLNHGAGVRQRNMLGLTAVHLAAGNGNLEALEILLSQDPDSVNVTSELKETALFFAAKNDHVECAQLLLRFGATTDVHNLRRERPIDLAKSQQMRSSLNRTSIVITNRPFQQKYTACIHSDEVVLETCEMLLKEAEPSSDSLSSDGKICKYYGSPTGCIRGSKCFYKHGEEDIPISKSRLGFARSAVLCEFKRKIFIGGLPPTLDSESLWYIMEEEFGPVADARVLEMETDGQIVSRGFGFVTFKHENSVDAAVEAHYTYIWGKRVEMKSAVPKFLLSQEDYEDESQQLAMEQENSRLIHSQAPSPSKKSRSDGRADDISWADRVVKGQPARPIQELKAQRLQSTGKKMPEWFNTFKKWLPQFLRKASANLKEGEFYSLSSLKADFKLTFGLELDHASLGYSKLSDFIRSLPKLCAIKTVHTGGQVPNHMILVPKISPPPPMVIPKGNVSPPCHGKQTHENSDDSIDSHTLCEEPRPSSSKDDSIKRESEEGSVPTKIPQTNIDATTDMNNVHDKTGSRTIPDFSFTQFPADNARLLQFLEPDLIFLARTWLGSAGGFKSLDPHCRPKHSVLEALARKRKEVFFLRSLKFCKDYAACLQRGVCFGCEKNLMLWANYPCQHLLWCGDCKLVAMKVAAVGTCNHKCVLCDCVVEEIDLISRPRMPRHSHNNMEFLLTIHAAKLQRNMWLKHINDPTKDQLFLHETASLWD